MKDFNKISDYLDGDLSPKETSSFKDTINNDPSLKGEVNRHEMLIEGIKAARHNELKARLAAIPVSAGIAFRTKIAIGIAAVFTATLGFFGYQQLNGTTIDSPANQEIAITSNTETKTKIVEEIIEEKISSENNSIAEEITKTDFNTNYSDKTTSQTTSYNIAQTNDNEVNTIIEIPDVDDFIDDEQSDQISANHTNGNSPDNFKSSDVVAKRYIQPVIKNNNSKTLQYLYDNNNLTLFGDFSSEEYLVLDYRQSDKVFLYFDNKFYELKAKKRKTTLDNSLIKDPALNAQLRAELHQ